jgi:hypothetical protein
MPWARGPAQRARPQALGGGTKLRLFLLLVARAAAAQNTILANDFLNLTITASPTGTCISSLSFNLSLAAASGWTPNLLSSGCVSRAWNGASGSVLEVQGAGVLFPSGGAVTLSSSTAAVVSGISLGSVATEEWRISLTGATLSWNVSRAYAVGGVALSDQAAALWLQSTTGGYAADARRDAPGYGNWTAAVQLPSFLSLDDSLLDPATGAGYAIVNHTRVAVLGDAIGGDARRVYLSPAGVAAHVSLSDCRFGFYRPHTIFVQALGFGAECAAGAAGGVAFRAGDRRNVALAVELRPTTQGHGFFDLTVPAGSPAEGLVATLQTWAKIFQLPLGWINGNSPACETVRLQAAPSRPLANQRNELFLARTGGYLSFAWISLTLAPSSSPPLTPFSFCSASTRRASSRSSRASSASRRRRQMCRPRPRRSRDGGGRPL